MPVAKEQIRQIIADNNINSVADVYTFLMDEFKDILQELTEAELDATLGYEKNQKGNMDTTNKRNGYSPRNSRASTGNSRLMSPGTGMANSSRKSFPSTRGMSPESKKRSSHSMTGV